MIDQRRLPFVFATLSGLFGNACSDPGPLECIVTDEATASIAVTSPDSCPLVRIQGGPFTDLSAFSELDRSVTLWIENAPNLTTTQGLPELRGVLVGDASLGGLPVLTDVSIKARADVFVGAPSALSIDVTFAQIVDGDIVNEAHSLSLVGITTPSVALRFDDEGSLDRVHIKDVSSDLTITALPAMPEVEGLEWVRTVPEGLSVLQQFGRPTGFVNFMLLTNEGRPIVADYVRWLREEAPNTQVRLTDDNAAPLELSEIGVAD